MIRIERIPEYLVEIKFHHKNIHCFDLIGEEIVASVALKRSIKEIQKRSFNSFLAHDIGEEAYRVYVDLVHEVSQIATGAQYILELVIDSPNHGYYFGTYEIGEFSLLNNSNLILERSFPIQYCLKGCITPSKQFYFGLRESETLEGPHSYFLIKLDWNKKPDPLILWKKPIQTAIMSILLLEHRLFLGLKNGTLQIWE